MYCEDSCANQIDHFRPKNFYPNEVFVWENYCHACGSCNGPKSDLYAIFSRSTGQRIDIVRRTKMFVVPPEDGDPLLINPRFEDPLEFMWLDLQDTFWFLPIADEGSVSRQRAEYTIEVLGLNKRDVLVQAREEAYGNYHARLQTYVHLKGEGKPQAELDRYRKALQRMQHPTVWKEMQRQHTIITELKSLFVQLPESVNW